jgi:putative endonuclease
VSRATSCAASPSTANRIPGFSKKYNLTQLIWYEVHEDIRLAIQREKNLKRWYRDWKIALVEESNPEWRDLFAEMSGLAV